MPLNIPILLPDQTIESACAMTWAMNGWPRWSDALRAVFGSAAVSPERLLHGGFLKCFQALSGGGHERPEALLEHHGFVSLVKPFMDAQNYKYAAWKMMETPTFGNKHFRGLVRDSKYYCSACIAEEMRSGGFAYTHRSHQIVGTLVCHAHGNVLAPLKVQPADGLAAHGFLTAARTDTSASWRLDVPCHSGPVTAGQRRLASFINASLRGKIPRVSHELRHSIFAHQLRRRSHHLRTEHAVLNDLQNSINESFDKPFLESIHATFLAQLRAHLSLILLGHWHYVENPLANLAVMSVFFETPQMFSNAAETQLSPASTSPSTAAAVDFVAPTFGLAKSLFRSPVLVLAARKNGVEDVVLRKYMAVRPTLARRRKQAITKKRRRIAQLGLLRFMQAHPSGGRKEFYASNLSNHAWLRVHDNEWLSRLFPH